MFTPSFAKIRHTFLGSGYYFHAASRLLLCCSCAPFALLLFHFFPLELYSIQGSQKKVSIEELSDTNTPM